MIYIPLWFKLFSQKQKALHDCNTALVVLFIKVRRGGELSPSQVEQKSQPIKSKKKKFEKNKNKSKTKTVSRVTPTEKKKKTCIVSRVLHCTTGSGYLLKIIHWIYFTVLTCDTKKVRARQTTWYAWQLHDKRTSHCARHVLFSFFLCKIKTVGGGKMSLWG